MLNPFWVPGRKGPLPRITSGAIHIKPLYGIALNHIFLN